MNATRRTFLAAVAATAVPFTSEASLPVTVKEVAASSLDALISAYDEATAEAERIYELEQALWDDPARPEPATMNYAELSYSYRWHMRHKAVVTLAGLHELFDTELKLMELNSTLHTDKNWLAPRVAKIEADRAHYLSIWNSKEAIYDEWAVSSGYRRLGEELDRLSTLESELNDAIIRQPVMSIQDVRAKAAHVKKVYGSSIAGEDQATFLTTLMSAGVEA